MKNNTPIRVFEIARTSWNTFKLKVIPWLILATILFVTHSSSVSELNSKEVLKSLLLGPGGFVQTSNPWFVLMIMTLFSDLKNISAKTIFEKFSLFLFSFLILLGFWKGFSFVLEYYFDYIELQPFARFWKIGGMLVCALLQYFFMRASLGVYLFKENAQSFITNSFVITKGHSLLLYKSQAFLLSLALIFYALSQLSTMVQITYTPLLYAARLLESNVLFVFLGYVVFFYQTLAKELNEKKHTQHS